MNQKKKEILAGALAAVVLIAALILGQTGERSHYEGEFLSGSAQTAGEAGETDEPVLSEKELLALQELTAALQSDRGDAVARILDRKQETFVRIFYDALKGERWLFDGTNFSREIEGEGLVLTLPSTVFYGEFHQGNPDGTATALQFVNVDSPRYNYSRGLWKDGRMEGEGMTGYCYYETIPSGEHKRTEKKGRFKENRLEGEFEYKIVGGDGSISLWTMKAERGVLVLDEKWKYLEEEKEYQLTADNQEGHAYLLSEDQAAQPIWENLILW